MPSARILIVEDEPELRSSLALRLRASGYEVCTAGDELDAVEEVLESPPALILLDIRLGSGCGHAVMDKLRRITNAREIPVIFLTASTSHADLERARGRGARAYITKPFDPEILLAIIGRVIAAPV